MPSRLDGQVVIVAGGTRGMGEAIVRGIVANGGQVVFGGRDSDNGRSIAEELGGAAGFVKLDVTNENDWREIVQQAQTAFGRVDGLVNCAGISERMSLEDTDAGRVTQMVATNQTSFLIGMKHAVPAMRAAGGGSIVNIGSVSATRGFANLSAYAATKGAVAALSKSAALELAPEGIRVNTIHPGPFMTKMLLDSLGDGAEEFVAQVTPMGRGGNPEEIVGPVIFLLSNDSSFVTGAELAVDGGRAI